MLNRNILYIVVVALTCVDGCSNLYTLVITDQSNVKLYPFSVNGRYYKWQFGHERAVS